MTDKKNTMVLTPTPTLEGPIQTTGTIKEVELREANVPGQDEPVVYADLHIAVEHKELNGILGGSPLRVGYPARVSADTKLGQLLRRFGFDIAEPVDVSQLEGRAVNVNCYKAEGSDGGMFWRVERDTVLPAASG